MSLYEELYQAVKLRFGDVNASQSMGEWICSNTTIKKRPFSFEGYQFQKAIADDMHPKVSVKKCSQIGLPVHVDTKIPTPSGWTTMGEVAVGQEVFRPDGTPVKVLYKSDVYTDRVCYRIHFDDGTFVECDEHHRWPVDCHRAFTEDGGVDQIGARNGRPRKSEGYTKKGLVTTRAMARCYQHQGHNLYSIDTAQPLALPDADLPLSPYYLGVLMGDGCVTNGQVTASVEDAPVMADLLRAEGLDVAVSYPEGRAATVRLRGVVGTLRSMGLATASDKHVPFAYLRASTEQRLALLQGLLDTDGSITKSGRVSFHNTNPRLVEAVLELARSLGFKPKLRWRDRSNTKPVAMKDGRVIQSKRDIAEVSWVAYDDMPMFRLDRKRERQRARSSGRPTENSRRYVTKIEEIPSVPVQCLMVDCPDHLFLVGEGMIPTCNTEVQLRKFLAILTRSTGIAGLFSMPNEKMFTKTYNGRIKPILEADSVFNPPTSTKPTRSKDQIQIRDSFGYITGCTESDATSLSCDFLFHDELDLSPQEIIGLYQSRLQGSDMQITQSFSTPTFAGYGIDKDYQLTDQREYFCRCPACRHFQVPRFTPKFVHVNGWEKFDLESFTDLTAQQIAMLDLEDCHVRCEKCQRRLDLGNPELREWVATYPTRMNFRGYQVRPFSTSRIRPGYIFGQLAQYQEKSFTRGFYNTVLGEEYTAADARLQKADIEACMAKGTAGIPDVSADTPCYLGIDVGFTCYLTVSHDDAEGFPVFDLFDTVPAAFLEERVKELCQIYNIVQGAIDRFPYTPQADALRDSTNGLIVPIQYRGNAALQPVNEPDTKNLSHYSANNTLILDRIQTIFQHRKATISGYKNQRDVLIAHLTDMVRNDKPGEAEQAEWMKTTGNDHYMHAIAFNLLARRVSDHMFATQLSTIATSASFLGASFGNDANSALNFMGTSNLRGAGRIAGLG